MAIIFEQSCLDELRSPRNFLSDSILEFYFNYLSKVVYPSDLIALVPPTISHFIGKSVDSDESKECIKSLGLNEKDLVMFPVNKRGVHWSVLVYHKVRARESGEVSHHFVHHDSMKGMNNDEAFQLYSIVREHVESPLGKTEAMAYYLGATPQQTNGYDCGLYVMAICKMICHWFCDDSPAKKLMWFEEVTQNVNRLFVGTMRPRVLRLIEEASCGRLGSVSCTLEAREEICYGCDSPKEEEADDFGTLAKRANDCGTLSLAPSSSTTSRGGFSTLLRPRVVQLKEGITIKGDHAAADGCVNDGPNDCDETCTHNSPSPRKRKLSPSVGR